MQVEAFVPIRTWLGGLGEDVSHQGNLSSLTLRRNYHVVSLKLELRKSNSTEARIAARASATDSMAVVAPATHTEPSDTMWWKTLATLAPCE